MGLEMLAWVAWSLLGLSALAMVRHSKTRPENLDKHPVRRRILDIVRRKPGAIASELCRSLDMEWGTIQYHLHLLESAQLLESVAMGRDRNFFVPDLSNEMQRRFAILRRGRVPDVVQAVADEPGINQRGLSRRIDMSRKVVREYVNLLEAEGLLATQHQGGRVAYFPTNQLYEFLRSGDATALGAADAALDGPGPLVH
jgi:predicted transcriptional regulator